MYRLEPYGGLLEMPQKVCGADILHVMGYAFVFKCPKIEPIHFRFFFRFQIDHVFFSRNAPIFYVRYSLNVPFSESDGKMGHFEKKTRDQF